MNNNFINTYNEWNEKKKLISIKNKKYIFKSGDIWWCFYGLNIGTESFGKGIDFAIPVLVIKKLSQNSCIVIPLTSKEKVGTWFLEIKIHKERRWLMLNQIRMISVKRFQRRIVALDENDFLMAKQKLKQMLELS